MYPVPTSGKPSPCSGMHEAHKLFIIHVQQLIQVNTTVGELAKGSLLLGRRYLSCSHLSLVVEDYTSQTVYMQRETVSNNIRNSTQRHTNLNSPRRRRIEVDT